MKKVLLLLICILFLSGCMVRVKTMEEIIDEANIEVNAPDYLKVTSRITYDVSDLMVLVENTSDNVLSSITIKAEYLNKDGNIIDTYTNKYEYVDAKASILGFTILPKNDKYESYIPDTIKLTIEVEGESDTLTYNKDIETVYLVEEDQLTVDVVNNSKKALNELNIVVLYYYNNKMVHYNEVMGVDVKSKEVIQDIISIPNDLIYDDIKIIVNRAY